MRKFPKLLGMLGLAGLTVFIATFALDRLVLAPVCPPCHTEFTRGLPMLSPSTHKGLVQIPANGFRFRARVAGLNNTDGEGVILLHGYPETSIM